MSILIGDAFAVPHLIICMHRCTHCPPQPLWTDITQSNPIYKRNLHFAPLFTPCCSYPPHFLRTIWLLAASRRIVSLHWVLVLLELCYVCMQKGDFVVVSLFRTAFSRPCDSGTAFRWISFQRLDKSPQGKKVSAFIAVAAVESISQIVCMYVRRGFLY